MHDRLQLAHNIPTPVLALRTVTYCTENEGTPAGVVDEVFDLRDLALHERHLAGVGRGPMDVMFAARAAARILGVRHKDYWPLLTWTPWACNSLPTRADSAAPSSPFIQVLECGKYDSRRGGLRLVGG